MFFYGLLESVIVKFLQKDIDNFFLKSQINESTKKIVYGVKRKPWNRETNSNANYCNCLAATDKG